MVAALSPELALDYLGELSTDIRAAVVLDETGECVAGDPGLAHEVRELLSGDEPLADASRRGGRIFAARGRAHSLGLLTGRFAIPALMRHDIQRVLEDLEPHGA